MFYILSIIDQLFLYDISFLIVIKDEI